LKGWHQMGLADRELEGHGVALFEGLFTSFARGRADARR
jgi:hypothetical protein